MGEALVSFLDEKGTPGIVQRAFICPPASQIGPITPEQRKKLLDTSIVAGQYEKTVDRESAFEKLSARAGERTGTSGPGMDAPSPAAPRGRRPESILETMAKGAIRAAGSQLGRQVIRGVLGSILGGGSRR